MTLKDCIHRDIGAVFLNTDEFCDNMKLHVGASTFSVVGSLQGNSVSNNSGNGGPLQECSWTLYLRYPIEGVILSAGQHITIDGKSYTVVDVADENGLATVNLTTRVGR